MPRGLKKGQRPAVEAKHGPKCEAWKAAKVVAALNRYRIKRAAGENLLPLSTVMVDMAGCPAVDTSTKSRFPEEWLRKLTHGTAGLWLERVNAVAAFLIYEGMLTEHQLSDDIVEGEMFSVYEALGRSDAYSRERFKTMPETFKLRTLYGADELVQLQLTKRADADIFSVEEVHYGSSSTFRTPKDANVPIFRRGYAFFTTRESLLTIFLRGGIPSDRVQYVEVLVHEAKRAAAGLRFIRLGLSWSGSRDTGETGDGLPAEACGVVEFTTDEVIWWTEMGMIDYRQRKSPASQYVPREFVHENDVFRAPQGALPPRTTDRDEYGMTVLHRAAAEGARSRIRALIEHRKCDFLIQDNLGRYASDIAIEIGRDPALGRLLTKHQIRQARERGVPAWEPPKAK